MKEHREQEASACSGLEERETNSLDNAAGTRLCLPQGPGSKLCQPPLKPEGHSNTLQVLFTLENDKASSSFHPFGRLAVSGTGTWIRCVAQSLHHKTILEALLSSRHWTSAAGCSGGEGQG